MINLCIPSPPDKSTWLGADLATRSVWSSQLFLGHPPVAQILRHIGERLEHLDRTEQSSAIAIIGGTGAGKSTLVKQLLKVAESRYVEQCEERTLKPFIQLSIPVICNPYEISVSILEALGEGAPRARRDKAATIAASGKFLKTCKVRLIVIDNLQDIPERRGKRGIEVIAAHLRNLIDASSALWVFLGTSAAVDVLHSNDQLLRRVAHRTNLNYFSVGDTASNKHFVMVLQQLDRWLPLAQPSCLTDPKVAGMIFVATEGIFDRIVKLLDRAWLEAVQAGTEVLDVDHLAAAYSFVNGSLADTANPFAKDFNIRLLDQLGEPFEVLHGGAKHARRKA
jgi:archaellum biogenesis ATPase FlaH